MALMRGAGSDAQREVFEDTLIAACAMDAGKNQARALPDGRPGRRPRARSHREETAAHHQCTCLTCA